MSWLSNFLGQGKRDTTYKGDVPYMSLSQSPGGAEYYKTIQDRLAGRGVGFGDTYASKYANPIIQNSRQQFEDYQIPELTSELSATGRRRGSGGFDQMRRAYNEQGNQEGDIFSRLQIRNEDVSHDDVNDAFNKVGDYAKTNADMRNNAVNFAYNQQRDQVGDMNRQKSTARDQFGKVVDAAATVVTGVPISSFGGSGGGGGGFNDLFSGAGGYYRPTPPPSNYDYGNLVSRNLARNNNARNSQLGYAAR